MTHKPTPSLEKMFRFYFNLTQHFESYVINLVISLNFFLFIFVCVENSKGIGIVAAVFFPRVGVTVGWKPVRWWHLFHHNLSIHGFWEEQNMVWALMGLCRRPGTERCCVGMLAILAETRWRVTEEFEGKKPVGWPRGASLCLRCPGESEDMRSEATRRGTS